MEPQKIADNSDSRSLASQMRRKRMAQFLPLLEGFSEPIRILDVGGTFAYWQELELPRKCTITLLNIGVEDCAGHPAISSVAGAARNMSSFADQQFDLCFSNSVIEHVGTLHDQIQMGREIQRVARAFFVQTPNRYFPLEPHFLIPLWQFYPKTLRAALLRRFDLGWMKRTPDPLAARAEVEQIRLLSAAEMQQIFPTSEILRETLGPFTKSLIARKSV